MRPVLLILVIAIVAFLASFSEIIKYYPEAGNIINSFPKDILIIGGIAAAVLCFFAYMKSDKQQEKKEEAKPQQVYFKISEEQMNELTRRRVIR